MQHPRRMNGVHRVSIQRQRANRLKVTRPRRHDGKNHRLVVIIKRERTELAALRRRIQEHEEATTKSRLEVTSLRAQLVEVKSTLSRTSLLIEEGFNSLHSAKKRIDQLSQEINQSAHLITTMDTVSELVNGQTSTSSGMSSTNVCVSLPSTSAGTSNHVSELVNGQTSTSSGMSSTYVRVSLPSTSASTSNHAPIPPPPKLQARVNPMVQGVPLMSPSIMLQRLQPDDLERQMSSSSRATTAATPPSPSIHEASVTMSEEGESRPHDPEEYSLEYGVQITSSGFEWNSGGQRNTSHPLRRSSRLRRQ